MRAPRKAARNLQRRHPPGPPDAVIDAGSLPSGETGRIGNEIAALRVGPTTPTRATARARKRPTGKYPQRAGSMSVSNAGCDQSGRGAPPLDRNGEPDPCLLGSPVGRDKGRNALRKRPSRATCRRSWTSDREASLPALPGSLTPRRPVLRWIGRPSFQVTGIDPSHRGRCCDVLDTCLSPSTPHARPHGRVAGESPGGTEVPPGRRSVHRGGRSAVAGRSPLLVYLFRPRRFVAIRVGGSCDSGASGTRRPAGPRPGRDRPRCSYLPQSQRPRPWEPPGRPILARRRVDGGHFHPSG